MRYASTKTYGHELGLSACFRQWRAKSHCNQLHGYALSFKLIFTADTLDENNWVVDFGSLKPIKNFLVDTFDHRLLVAADDPMRERLMSLWVDNLAIVQIVDNTGCEAFAKLVGDYTSKWLQNVRLSPRVKLASVECREHGANSGIWLND